MAQKDRCRKLDAETKARIEKRYGIKLPDRSPSLQERWEKEQELYKKKLAEKSVN